MNDKELITLLQQGNEHVFDTLYRKYYTPLCGFASSFVDPAAGEEIVQDVMLWLWEHKQTLQPDGSIKSFLFTLVKNRCLNEIAHQKVKQRVHENIFDKINNAFEDPNFYVEQELMQKIDHAITALPRDFKEAFVLNRFEDCTYQEIADRTGVSVKTIAYRISQSLKQLRVSLKDYIIP
jgi:RNA polymerase sigma-70 factor (ECF subfamily)